MVSYALVLLAALFNAVMDATENAPNFNESIFKRLSQKFWLKEVSWKAAKKIFGYKLDAWHLAKSCMILCFVAAILTFENKHQWWVYLMSFAAIWNLGFDLFYHWLLKVK